jgi:hypothetical protein
MSEQSNEGHKCDRPKSVCVNHRAHESKLSVQSIDDTKLMDKFIEIVCKLITVDNVDISDSNPLDQLVQMHTSIQVKTFEFHQELMRMQLAGTSEKILKRISNMVDCMQNEQIRQLDQMISKFKDMRTPTCMQNIKSTRRQAFVYLQESSYGESCGKWHQTCMLELLSYNNITKIMTIRDCNRNYWDYPIIVCKHIMILDSANGQQFNIGKDY